MPEIGKIQKTSQNLLIRYVQISLEGENFASH